MSRTEEFQGAEAPHHRHQSRGREAGPQAVPEPSERWGDDVTATVHSLSSRYAQITGDLAKMTAAHAGPDGQAAMSRLILRAAILNANEHNGHQTVAATVQATLREIENRA